MDIKQTRASKLPETLFRTPFRSFHVVRDEIDDWEDFEGWNLQPLLGATLAKEYVQGPFEGLFILQAQIVAAEGMVEDCYLDLVLPERICEHRFVLMNNTITRIRGRRLGNATAIPSIAIEKLGDPQLFHAKENPSAGIEVLQQGLRLARAKKHIAYDLGVLLRVEKRFDEAIAAFSIFLEEDPESDIAHSIYRQRSQLHRQIGHFDKAEEDRRLWEIAFTRAYGHPPSSNESF
jgi:tetratricopeptide (TPR) repeat protein